MRCWMTHLAILMVAAGLQGCATCPERGRNMEEAKIVTEEQAHQHLALALNGVVWDLLRKPDRSKADDERMVHAAHASCYHWLKIGTGLHHQRGEWLIAHVYSELGHAGAALRHASRCLELTREHADLMEDFDRAYACEAMARAYALVGNLMDAGTFLERAAEAGRLISNEEDRKIFLSDFEGGNWYGLR